MLCRGGAEVLVTFGSDSNAQSLVMTSAGVEIRAQVLGSFGPSHIGGALIYYVDKMLVSQATRDSVAVFLGRPRCWSCASLLTQLVPRTWSVLCRQSVPSHP